MDDGVTEVVAGSRFEIRRRLGSGGFGEVFEAWDRQRDSTIALKTLHQQNPRAIRRFKHEFRSLAGLSHRNLVQLYELVADGDQWSFTMELVQGEDFLSAVGSSTALQPDSSELVDTLEGGELSDVEVGRPPAVSASYSPERLRSALIQLSRGLRALHAAGKLHRDIKPQNVLVTEKGRVVILDFGMVKELAAPRASGEGAFVGTPHYMAPEQALGEDGEAGEAADWYAVGVMLYEVLCGEYPVTGRSAMQVLLRKQMADSPPDDAFPTATPDDLRTLCQRLLSHQPDERPGPEEVLRLLGDIEESADEGRFARRDGPTDGPFVGRKEELGRLRSALEGCRRRSEANVVEITGASGIGKTELVRQFVSELAEDPDIWVLRGRCYENESVPYKALDGVVDSLTDHLATLEPERLERWAQGDLPALAQVFGVFGNLRLFRDAAVDIPPSTQSPELRKSAFTTLRGLVTRMCEHVTPLIVVDDVQWGDRDSADVLAELLREPAPPVLVVTTFRTDDRSQSPFLHRFETVIEERDVVHTEIRLRELSEEESGQLVRELAGDDDEMISRIVGEAKGSPYFIDELARFRAPTDARDRTLGDAIEDRLKALDESMRRFLEVIALAGRPLDVRIAREVAGARIDLPHTMARLRNERLVRVHSDGDHGAVEAYHDRIRETVRDRLPGEKRRRSHLRLARVLERETSADPEMLAVHFREGGDPRSAAKFAALAADAAMDALAFDRAASGYREALDLGDWERAERKRLLERLAEAQSYMGHGNQASDAYVKAASLADVVEAQELRRRAAEQLLRAGQVERGMELLYAVLGGLDVRLPRSDKTLDLRLLWISARNAIRGLSYTLRDEPIDPLDAIRLDTCWSAARLLGTIDIKRGAYFQLLALPDALDSGDPERISRALALQAVHYAGRASTRDRARQLVEEADELTSHLEDTFTVNRFVDFSAAMTYYMAGDMQEGQRRFAGVRTKLEQRASEFVGEIGIVRLHELYTLFVLGRLDRYADAIPPLLEESRDRDDLLEWTALSVWDHIRHLTADDPETAEARLDEATSAWTSSGYHLQHFWALQARVRIELYRGNPEAALGHMDDGWRALKRGFMLHYDLTRAIAYDLRSRTLLAVAQQKPGRRRKAMRRARRDIARLESVSMDFAAALATLLRAQYSHLAGEYTSRDELLARAEAQFGSMGAETFVAAARLRLGQALGARRGHELRARVVEWAEAEGIEKPETFLGVVAPVCIETEGRE